jgi:hypothetical protein
MLTCVDAWMGLGLVGVGVWVRLRIELLSESGIRLFCRPPVIRRSFHWPTVFFFIFCMCLGELVSPECTMALTNAVMACGF